MALQARFDSLTLEPLGPPRETDAGFLLVEGRITRSGVLEYRNKDGTIRRELRSDAEVFEPSALERLNGLPLTLRHPPEGLLTPSTVKARQVGTVFNPRRDGDHVRADILITDREAIEAAKKGIRQLSLGYISNILPESGTIDGESYDVLQTDVRPNHVALLLSGRAGELASIRMDGANTWCPEGTQLDTAYSGCEESSAPVAPSVPATSTPPLKEKKMKTLRLDGKDVNMEDDVAAAVEKALAGASATQARLDAALEEVAVLKVKADPKTQREAIQARIQLEVAAKDVLGEQVKLDGLEDVQVKAEVVRKLAPSAQLEGKDKAYIDARFDAAMENRAEARKSHTGAGPQSAAAVASAPPTMSKSEAAAKRMHERLSGKTTA